MVPVRVNTRGAVRQLTTGDFDGDLLGDVAFVEAGPPGASDLLDIAYGGRDKAPSDPIRIAEVSGVEQLGAESNGNFQDVFAASNQGGRGIYTLFVGDTNRLPIAAYTLVSFSADGNLEDAAASTMVAPPGSTIG